MNYPYYTPYQQQMIQQPMQYQQQLLTNPYNNFQQQNQMQQTQQFTPFVKFVDNVEMVKATDIPMDGNSYYFPKADRSEIYAKQWLNNGTTQIVVYVPKEEKKQENQQPIQIFDFESFQNDIMEKLSDIDSKVNKMQVQLNRRPKKEEVQE